MFKLNEELVESIEINGKTYKVDMSFDNILNLTEMLSDKELSDELQILLGIKMLFDEPLDMPIDEQAKIFFEAYQSLIGNDADKDIEYDLLGNPMPRHAEEESEQLYDLQQDAEYIYASFMQDYGIDLIEQQGELHWYKFRALLAGLSDNTKFKKVIEIRQMPLPTGKNSSKHRAEVEKLKRAYALKNKAVSE
ncbi:MAG: bacteriophage Gp15 family protein [Psychrobacillus sp.]